VFRKQQVGGALDGSPSIHPHRCYPAAATQVPAFGLGARSVDGGQCSETDQQVITVAVVNVDCFQTLSLALVLTEPNERPHSAQGQLAPIANASKPSDEGLNAIAGEHATPRRYRLG